MLVVLIVWYKGVDPWYALGIISASLLSSFPLPFPSYPFSFHPYSPLSLPHLPFPHSFPPNPPLNTAKGSGERSKLPPSGPGGARPPNWKKKKKKKFIWLNVITMNMTIYNIIQSQVARKPWGQPSWPPKHIQFIDYHTTKTTIVNTYYYYTTVMWWILHKAIKEERNTND